MIIDVNAIIVMSLVLLVTYAWVPLIAKVFRRIEILPFEPRRATPWGIIAVVLSFLLFLGVQLALGAAFGMKPGAELTVEQTDALLTWTAIATLAATLTSIGLLHLFTKAGPKDFGISLENVPRDLFVGCYGFLVFGPIAFLIQFVCVYVFQLESHHPLIEALKDDSTGRLFAVVTLLTVVVAPISEEYFFRVLLQGWLEKFFLFNATHDDEFGGDSPAEKVAKSTGTEAKQTLTFVPKRDSNAKSSLVPTDGHNHRYRFVISSIPIVISATVFSLMHWSHGPDPAALFVLAVGLGYLYQRTHRWLPCAVTHACLNGTTMLILWFGLDQIAR